MSVYDEALARNQEWMRRELMKAVGEQILPRLSSPAHQVGVTCRTCGGTGLVEDLYEGHGGLVYVSCPDCPGEPFPLP